MSAVRAARALARGHPTRFAHVGHRGEAAAAVDAQPGAASLEITPGEDIGIFPPVRVTARARVVLVAIGDHDQRVIGMLLPGKQDQAHGFIRMGSGRIRVSKSDGKLVYFR